MYKKGSKEYYMELALKEAKKAYKIDEVPVGVIIVKKGNIIARAYNMKEKNNSSIEHAEIRAIKKAEKKLNNWRLNDCEMYVTLEPCAMCAGAIIHSRIKKVYIGTMEPKFGSVGSILNLMEFEFNHEVGVEYNILKEESEKLLKNFFKEKRQKNK